MGKNTEITWCHHSWNPWWGCQRVSPGCEHCYAETFDKRLGGKHWGPPTTTERRFFGPKHWAEPLKWNADAEQAGERRRVFCASMADVFEDNAALDGERMKLWRLIEQTPALDWLLLTKRPENIHALYMPAEFGIVVPNVWLGTTVESQEYAEKRLPELVSVPAAVHFASCEPLLGPLDLTPWLWDQAKDTAGNDYPKGLDWVIVGGESGHGGRPMEMQWARDLRDQCHAVARMRPAAFHMKQTGAFFFNGKGKGEQLDELPADLRIREFPESAHAA